MKDFWWVGVYRPVIAIRQIFYLFVIDMMDDLVEALSARALTWPGSITLSKILSASLHSVPLHTAVRTRVISLPMVLVLTVRSSAIVRDYRLMIASREPGSCSATVVPPGVMF